MNRIFKNHSVTYICERMRRDTFQAIADPNRREIIELLVKEKLSLNKLAAHFNISRPAISKHVKILEECGMVKVTSKGRERFCEARTGGLKDVTKWLSKFEQETPAKKTKPVTEVPSEKKSKKKKGKKKKK